jgi:hypothetical protein
VGDDGGDRQVYEGIGTAVRDWRERRLTWHELLDRIEQASVQLSAAGQPQGEELSWRLDRLRGLGAPTGDGHAPPAPTRLLERELKQITKVGPDWQPPPPRPHRPRSTQWLTFAGLLAAYGGVDVFFGKTSLAILAFALAAVFAALALHARTQERRRAGRSRSAPALPDAPGLAASRSTTPGLVADSATTPRTAAATPATPGLAADSATRPSTAAALPATPDPAAASTREAHRRA